jgi:hypothetical protein
MLIDIIFLEYSRCIKPKSNMRNKAEMNGLLLLLSKQMCCYRLAIPKTQDFSRALPMGKPSALRKNSTYSMSCESSGNSRTFVGVSIHIMYS